MNTIGSSTYQLVKFLAKTLKSLAGQTFSYIKDSSHFIKDIKDIQVCENEIMVGFDVVSLYTKVPVEEAIKFIRNITNDEKTNMVRIWFYRICLKSTYFTFHDNFYEQTNGVLIGSPLSPVVANIYMEHFEKKALTSSP